MGKKVANKMKGRCPPK